MWRYKCWRFLRWSAWAAVALGVLATAWTHFYNAGFEIPFGHDRIGGRTGEGWRLLVSGSGSAGVGEFNLSLLTIDPGNVALGGRGGRPIRASGVIVRNPPGRTPFSNYATWSDWAWKWESELTEGQIRTRYVNVTLIGASVGGATHTTTYSRQGIVSATQPAQKSYQRMLMVVCPFPYPTLLAAAFAWWAGRRTRAARSRAWRNAGLCHACAYNLTGISSDQCPECGTPRTSAA